MTAQATIPRERQAEILLRGMCALNDLARLMTSAAGLQQALEAIAETAAALLPSRAVSIHEWVPAARGFAMRYARGLPSALAKRLEWAMPGPENAAMVQALETQNTVSVPPLGAATGSVLPAEALAEDIRTLWVEPVLWAGQWVGCLCLWHSEETAPSPVDCAFLTSLAGQTSLAFQRARLPREDQQRISQLMALRQVSLQLISTTDLDSVLETIAESALHLVGASDAHIYLYNEQSDKFHFGTALWDTGERRPAVPAPRENGLTAFVAHRRERVVIPDITGHPLFQGPEVAGWELGAIAGFPLMRGEHVLGVFNIAFRRPHIFTEDELTTLDLLADQAALGIERAQLFAEMERRLAEATALYNMAQQTTSSLALDEVLDAIVVQLRSVISCRAICVFLLDEATQELTIAAATGLKAGYRNRLRLKIGEGVSGQVFERVRPIYVRDIPKEAPHLGTDPSIHSLLVVPLIAKDKVIGTLSVDSTEVDAFTSHHERLLTIAAAQAASAIENARLFATEQQRAEELRRAYEELKELDRLKSEFIQNVSHDLRTPLTFLKGYADLLLEEAMGPLSPTQKRAMDMISQNTDRLIKLVNDITMLHILQERRELPLQKSRVSLSELLHTLAVSSQAMANKAGIELRCEIPPLEMWVLADRDRLMQVFENLVSNAIKFSPDGGVITIRAQDADAYWQVAVQDTGIGIPPDKLDKVFDRFYQIDGSTTRRFGGSGLGLAIAKEIVTGHGGQIWAESVLGEGSTFYVCLPKAGEARTRSEATSGPPA